MNHQKQFSLERIVLFSDAVFAIAITLLIIEIKIPEIHGGNRDAFQKLLNLVPKFAGFFIGFLVIGVYWISHHRLFGYLKDFDTKLIWLNMTLLFSIVLMPFTSGFYAENMTLTVPYILYAANVIATGFLMTWMWSYVSNPANNLCVGLENRRVRRYYLLRALSAPVVWSLGLLLAVSEFWQPNPILITMSRSIYILIAPYVAILSRRYRDVAGLLHEGGPEES